MPLRPLRQHGLLPAIAVAAVFAAAPALVPTPCQADTSRVVAYRIVDGAEIPEPLTTAPPDVEAGRQLYFDRKRTNCSGCHGSPGGAGAQTDAAAANAPALAHVGKRLSDGVIRLWIVAPEVMDPETEMPAYYQVGQRQDPNDKRYGEPTLSAQEIENLIAYLMRSSR